jgi:HTH-type transcriptional regulator / antitoxin HigA
MRDIRAIHSEADYEWALREVEAYFDNTPEVGSEEASRFDVLSALISNYESQHHEIADVDPVEVLHFAITSMGRTQAELATIVGSRSRASEVLTRKRHLTLSMIRDISAAWKIPVACLTGAYELQRASA